MNVNQISEDEKKKLLDLGLKRLSASTSFFKDRRQDWERYYKIYRATPDDNQNSDEPNIFLPYAFGAVEGIVARITEPLLAKFAIKIIAKKREHADKAVRFSNIAKSVFGKSEYQLDYIESERECTIIGSAWENDEWVAQYAQGKQWIMKNVQEQIPGTVGTVEVSKMVEVDLQYPIKVGYSTRFPSAFLVHPEPGVKRADKLRWIIEEVPSIDISELETVMFTDPSTKQPTPVYDLTELKNDLEGKPEGSLKPEYPSGSVCQSINTGVKNAYDTSSEQSDSNKVHLLHVHEANRIFTIAQGKYVIRVVDSPFHKPGLKWRLRVYTQDKESLFGIGAIQPAEHLFYELNDTHNLHMTNAIRIVNKMIGYHEDMIPYKDDFKSRAGGKIRIKETDDVHKALVPVEQGDVTASMLRLESNSKGLLESVLSIADLSPGVEGTKAYHKTYGGMMEIQSNMAKRFGIMRRLRLANYQVQINEMYFFFEQFMHESMGFATYFSKTGQHSAVEYTREDINTNGLGFDTVIEEDPAFGDTQVQRTTNMVLFDMSLKYNEAREKFKDFSSPQASIYEMYKNVLESCGKSNTSKFFNEGTSEDSPEDELAMIVQGSDIMPSPFENLTKHLAAHIMQAQDPELLAAVQGQKLPPDTLKKLVDHIMMTKQLVESVAAKPEILGQMRKEIDMRKANDDIKLQTLDMYQNIGTKQIRKDPSNETV